MSCEYTKYFLTVHKRHINLKQFQDQAAKMLQRQGLKDNLKHSAKSFVSFLRAANFSFKEDRLFTHEEC